MTDSYGDWGCVGVAALSILSMLAGYRENCCGEGKGVAKRA